MTSVAATALAGLTVLLTAACGQQGYGGNQAMGNQAMGGGNVAAAGMNAGAVPVMASDTGCQLSTPTVRQGNVTFAITNQGRMENEFYISSANGQQDLYEVEGIGSGQTGTLNAQLPAGQYMFSCRPGGDAAPRINGMLTVTQ